MNKIFIDAQQLLTDSFELGLKIFHSGYRPDLLIGLWRGGAPIAIAVHELLDYLGIECDHMAIRTSSYTGIGRRNTEVTIDGLEGVSEKIRGKNSILVVDDVFETGFSLARVHEALRALSYPSEPQIKSAALYYKPKRQKTQHGIDFHLHQTDQWLVFPHELQGLSLAEALSHKTELAPLARRFPDIAPST